MIVSNIAKRNNSYSQSFGSNSFPINNIDGLECAYCGKKMISRKRINGMFKSPQDSDKLLLDIAFENADYLRTFQQTALNFLMQTRYYYSLDDDISILKKAKSLSGEEVRHDLAEKFNEIFNCVLNNGPKAVKQKLIDNAFDYKQEIMRKARFKTLARILYSYNGLNIKQDNSDFSKEISAIMENSVYSDYSIFSFILNTLRKKNSEDFYKELFLPSESTIEHIKPKSKRGNNSDENYLAVCRTCNSHRSSEDFEKVLGKPHVMSNIKKQLIYLKKILPQLISQGTIPEQYSTYIEAVTGNIKKQSRGKFDVEI